MENNTPHSNIKNWASFNTFSMHFMMPTKSPQLTSLGAFYATRNETYKPVCAGSSMATGQQKAMINFHTGQIETHIGGLKISGCNAYPATSDLKHPLCAVKESNNVLTLSSALRAQGYEWSLSELRT